MIEAKTGGVLFVGFQCLHDKVDPGKVLPSSLVLVAIGSIISACATAAKTANKPQLRPRPQQQLVSASTTTTAAPLSARPRDPYLVDLPMSG